MVEEESVRLLLKHSFISKGHWVWSLSQRIRHEKKIFEIFNINT